MWKWKWSKSLAACVFAAVWWGIFYPELYFSDGTCAVVQTENVQNENVQNGNVQNGNVQNGNVQSQQEEIDAAAVWRASGDEIVIGSRFWEWCEENLFDASTWR